MSEDQIDVLVVGAGPSGLALALQVQAYGARVRIVEQRAELFRPSRAMIMHSRTLEALRPLGVTNDLLAGADVAPRVDLHLGSRTLSVRLGDFGLGGSPFPRPILLRQSDVEAVLSQALLDRGVAVERGSELVGLAERDGLVRAQVRSAAGEEAIACRFLAGCDGGNSTVRNLARIGWRGGPYAEEVILADLELAGEVSLGAAQVVAARPGLLFLFPLGERAPWRLLATRAASRRAIPLGHMGPAVDRHDLQALLDSAGLPAAIRAAPWSAQVTLNHRLADTFRQGRIFLVGEAAHAHSPAGGQGMNTGVQDALNLGWKLAFLSRSDSPGSPDGPLICSYDLERRPTARRVLAMTHLMFWGEAGTGPAPSFLRGVLAPAAAPLLPLLLRRRFVAAGIWLLTQFWVHYRRSPLSTNLAPDRGRRMRPGDRVPDMSVITDQGQIQLQQLLADPGLHVLLQRDAIRVDSTAFGPWVHVHRIRNWPGSGALIVRPDGYVGFRSGLVKDEQLTRWLALATGRQG
ncbi:MAG TPA: FAD-dependent monooxygenase [Propionibacteriaceae bacterium]|nr:FAD-dependent monooxygenase [Propionibacteriaceae bacterium]